MSLSQSSSTPPFNRPGVTDKFLADAGCHHYGKDDVQEHGCRAEGIAIPFRSLDGEPILDNGKPLARIRLYTPVGDKKYHQRTGSGSHIYIPPSFRDLPRYGTLVLTEGEFKVLSLCEAGFSAIGLPGISGAMRSVDGEPRLHDELVPVLEFHRPARLLFLGDSDAVLNSDFARETSKLRRVIFDSKQFAFIDELRVAVCPLGGPKGVDDVRGSMGGKFNAWFTALAESAFAVPPKATPVEVFCALLGRESEQVRKALTTGVDRSATPPATATTPERDDASGPNVAGYEIHPLSLVFPPATEEELTALAESIIAQGQIHPAGLYEGKILDGRKRAIACDRVGIRLLTTPLPDGVDPVGYVVAANIRRRQFTAAQRAVVAAKLMPYYEAEAAKRKQVLSGTRANPDGSRPEVPEILPEPDACGDAREQAAKATGANARYVGDVLKLQREAPALFKSVDAGEISIPCALKQLGAQPSQDTDETTPLKRNEFLVVLLDDADAPPTRAPEKSYGAKTYPNIAFFRFHAAGDTKIDSGTKHGLTHVAHFVVAVEPNLFIKDVRGRPFCNASCRFLALSVRGNVPEPAMVPLQIVDDEFPGVVRMIEALFPDALKVLSSAQHEAPQGWQYVLRDKKVGADAALANEQAAAPLAVAPKPPAEAPVLGAKRRQAVTAETTEDDDAVTAEIDKRDKAALAAEATGSNFPCFPAGRNSELELVLGAISKQSPERHANILRLTEAGVANFQRLQPRKLPKS